jgi:hypothetical protein
MKRPHLLFCLLLPLLALVPLAKAQERILHAAPAALGKADGSSPAHALELQAAFEATRNPSGPITVLLADGHYRKEYTVPSRNNDNSAPPLTIKAANPGKAIIDGSDPVTDFNGPDANGVYEFPWTEGWGPATFRAPQAAHYEKPIYFRREMMFINDRRIEQVMAPDGLKALPTQDLQSGQFTVDETAKVIRFKPLEAFDSKKNRVEVSRRGARLSNPGGSPWAEFVPLLRANGIAHLTLDGLIIRRGANHNMAPMVELNAIRITRETFDKRLRNLTINRCQFIESSGKGMRAAHWIDVVIRQSEFSRNGNGGGGVATSDNVLHEDCTFADNNWRFGQWMANWDAAGSKILDGSAKDNYFTGRSENRTYRRCAFQRNAAGGFWTDWGPKNVILENCLIEDNNTGVLVEINIGPVIIRDSVIRRNAGGALYGVNSPDVTIERSVLIDAINESRPQVGVWHGGGIISVAGDTRNEGKAQMASMERTDKDAAPRLDHPPAEHYRSVRWTIRDSIVQSTTAAGRLFWARYWGNAANIGFNPATEFAKTFTSERNRFFQLGTEDAFLAPAADPVGAGRLNITYAPASALARIDSTSLWNPVSDAALTALDPRDGKRLELASLPLATDAERLAMLKRSMDEALRVLRLPAQGGGLRLSVRNPTTRPVTINGAVGKATGWVAGGDGVTIAPGQTGTLALTLKPGSPSSDSASLDLRLTATAEGLEPQLAQGRVELIRPAAMSLVATIAIDGDASEWAKVPAQEIRRQAQVFIGKGLLKDWGTPVDLRAKLQAATDGSHLLLAVAVQDDTRSVTDGPRWEQDALEIFWDTRPQDQRNAQHAPGTGQFIVAWPAADGPIPAKDWMHPRGQVNLEKVRSFAKRTADGWVLELAIPLSEIHGQPTLAAGSSIALNLNVSDRDGEDANVATIKRLTLTGEGDGNASTADYLPFIVK